MFAPSIWVYLKDYCRFCVYAKGSGLGNSFRKTVAMTTLRASFWFCNGIRRKDSAYTLLIRRRRGIVTQDEKGRAFRALHERDGAFIIPNPWDVGSARLLAHLGFEALATTSMGYAFSLGRRDNTLDREQVLAHARDISSATELPVSADLENGFGDSPAIAAETIRLAAAAGVIGGSIADATGRADHPIYEIDHAVERVRAAVEAARFLSFPFTLTARAENYLQ